MLERPFSRRQFLAGAAAASAVGMAPKMIGRARAESTLPPLLSPYKLPPLPYAASALAPVIDAETMALHHGKHHQAYIDKLNDALKDVSAAQSIPLPKLLRELHHMPEGIRDTVRNNGGGHLNHSMFWDVMAAPDSTTPKGALADALKTEHGSLETFQTAFNDAGTKLFGSGWVFLAYDPATKKLSLDSLPNQDTPYLTGKLPIFGNDVWEHAYYLNYRNKRADYLKAWWKVLNWDKAEERYAQAQAGTLRY